MSALTDKEKINRLTILADSAIFFLSAGSAMCHMIGDKETSDYLEKKYHLCKKELEDLTNDQ